MQGTDRAHCANGFGVWRRNLSPGETSILHGAQHDIFIQFQVLFQEICYWVVKSGQKRETGVVCCLLCAAEPGGQPAPESTRKRKRPSKLRILCSDCYDFRHLTAIDEQNSDHRIRTLVWDHFLGELTESENFNEKYAKLKATPLFFMDPPWPNGVDWTCAFDVLRGCKKFRDSFENLHKLNQEREFFLGFVHGCKFGFPHDGVSSIRKPQIQETVVKVESKSPDIQVILSDEDDYSSESSS